MKKIILCAAILLFFSATELHAQNGQQMQQAWQQYLKDSVQLSDVMVDSVLAIRTQYRPQMRDIFKDQSSSAADKQTKLQSLRAEMDVRYKADGLTDDQIQAIHKHEDAMRAQIMNRMNNGGGQ